MKPGPPVTSASSALKRRETRLSQEDVAVRVGQEVIIHGLRATAMTESPTGIRCCGRTDASSGEQRLERRVERAGARRGRPIRRSCRVTFAIMRRTSGDREEEACSRRCSAALEAGLPQLSCHLVCRVAVPGVQCNIVPP